MKSKKPIAPRICIHCGREFLPNGYAQKACSKECSKAHRSEYLHAYWKEHPNSPNHSMHTREHMRRKRAQEKIDISAAERAETKTSDGLLETAGINYGKARTAKILASIPRINTEL